MKILITGGAGFIGSWLTEALAKSGQKVVIVDNLSPQIHGVLAQSEMPWLQNENVEFICADIRNYSLMEEVLRRVEAVVHLAAETGTGQSMYQISHYYDVNQQATAAMFEAICLRHQHIKRIILASSRSIYGEGAYKLNERIVVPSPRTSINMKAGQFEVKGPSGEVLELIATPEDITASPASVYAATKLANEMLGKIIAEAYGITVLALRFQNVYGERQSLRNPYTGILSIFSNRMRQNLPINIFEDGLESRDFVHVSDIVCAIQNALEIPLAGFHAINIGSGVPTSVIKVAEMLRNFLESNSVLNTSGDFRVGDIRHCYADLQKASDAIGFKPAISIEQGLAQFCKWVKTQPVLKDQSERAMKELASAGLGHLSTD